LEGIFEVICPEGIVFTRLWKELGIGTIIRQQLKDRKLEFDVERAVFLTVLHRMFVSGSDRFCDNRGILKEATSKRAQRDYRLQGISQISENIPGQRHHRSKKINAEFRFDGKWVLKTNTNLPPEEVALT
jgi:hypothetical protein